MFFCSQPQISYLQVALKISHKVTLKSRVFPPSWSQADFSIFRTNVSPSIALKICNDAMESRSKFLHSSWPKENCWVLKTNVSLAIDQKIWHNDAVKYKSVWIVIFFSFFTTPYTLKFWYNVAVEPGSFYIVNFSFWHNIAVELRTVNIFFSIHHDPRNSSQCSKQIFIYR